MDIKIHFFFKILQKTPQFFVTIYTNIYIYARVPYILKNQTFLYN